MEIGILTFHHGFNHGGFLQVFSLLEYLKSLGHEATIINYINPTHKKNKFRMTYFPKNPFCVFFNISKKNIFQKTHTALHKTNEINDIEKLEKSFDLVILGSDEIWNFDNPMFGKDLTYFGKGIKTEKIISYAASFGTRSLEHKIDSDVIAQLKKLSSISVRDLNSSEILQRKVGIVPQLVVDPTFLVAQDEYLLVPPEGSRYLLFYGNVSDQKITDEIVAYARKEGLEIVSIGYRNGWCDRNEFNVDPFEWSGYVKNAEIVVTSMFHGLVYSLIHNKKFVFLMSKYRKNKVDYLIEHLGLENHVYDVNTQNLSKLFSSNVDYVDVNKKIYRLTCNSKLYLDKALRSE